MEKRRFGFQNSQRSNRRKLYRQEMPIHRKRFNPRAYREVLIIATIYKIIRGMVISTKMNRTVVIRRNYLHYVQKYKRFEKRHKNISVHLSPCFSIKEGDILIAGQCRPLSKTVRFNALKVIPNDIIGTARK